MVEEVGVLFFRILMKGNLGYLWSYIFSCRIKSFLINITFYCVDMYGVCQANGCYGIGIRYIMPIREEKQSE